MCDINKNLELNNINKKVYPNLHNRYEYILKNINKFKLINFYEFESNSNINNISSSTPATLFISNNFFFIAEVCKLI